MGLFGPFVYKSKKGIKWWLHMKQQGKRKLYFFSKNPIDALPALPQGYEVVENERTGLPMLRKKVGGILGGLGRVGKKKEQPAEGGGQVAEGA
jgi:hypothetical protein